VGPAQPCSPPGSSRLEPRSSQVAPEEIGHRGEDCVRTLRSHVLKGYPGSCLRSSSAGGPQRALQDMWASRKLCSSCSAPSIPRPTAPSGTGVQDGAKVTWKPASLRSSARACRVVAGAEAGDVTRVALVSRTASESAAEVVRARKTSSRAEPRSRSERASISPRMPRLPVSGSSVSRMEHLAVSGRAGRVGEGGRSSTVFQESVAENSSRPAVQIAMVPAGSPVGKTVVNRLSALRRARVWPTSLSGPPLVPARVLPFAGQPFVSESLRRRPRNRRTAGGASRGGS
jgi:hypothetical protein